jgi:hypothetical protein
MIYPLRVLYQEVHYQRISTISLRRCMKTGIESTQWIDDLRYRAKEDVDTFVIVFLTYGTGTRVGKTTVPGSRNVDTGGEHRVAIGKTDACG